MTYMLGKANKMTTTFLGLRWKTLYQFNVLSLIADISARKTHTIDIISYIHHFVNCLAVGSKGLGFMMPSD